MPQDDRVLLLPAFAEGYSAFLGLEDSSLDDPSASTDPNGLLSTKTPTIWMDWHVLSRLFRQSDLDPWDTRHTKRCDGPNGEQYIGVRYKYFQ